MELRVPGKQYARSVQQFTGELVNTIRRCGTGRTSFPIQRVFEVFPINVIDNTAGKQLRDRGAIEVECQAGAASGTFWNEAEEWLEVPFGDKNVGRVTVFFDERVEGEWLYDQVNNELMLDLSNNPVIVVLNDFPSEWGINHNQRLYQISFSPDQIVYYFVAQISDTDTNEIIVDLTLEPPEGSVQGVGAENAVIRPFEAGMVVACLVLTCVWCATDGTGVPDPDDMRPPDADREADYELIPDCVRRSGSRLLVYFDRDPFWEDHDKVLGKSAIIKYIWNNCKAPVAGIPAEPGRYKMRIDRYHFDLTLPHQVEISGPIIS